ncbi:uncharacterized protein LOC130444952 isoform X1 [Diorhabda sublineata]|uniref:uncharacterized protein LOC130444952 isoform X1 n=2 Tax=Diorhabda sublineata TaxID=1163346 RepID=UPI0024E0E103|nr:uncharacterized protein LOC130444952 isoform X1 [Diorhabda sublineata]
MSKFENIHDFESFLEMCTHAVQEGSMEKRHEPKSVYEKLYNYVKNQEDEIQQKKESLRELQLAENRLFQKINNAYQNVYGVIEQIKNLQDTIKTNATEYSQNYDEYNKQTTKLQEELQNLTSKLEENSLSDQIREVLKEIESSQEKERELEEEIKMILSNRRTDFYQPSAVIRTMIEELREIDDIDQITNMISEKEKDVKYLKKHIEQRNMY